MAEGADRTAVFTPALTSLVTADPHESNGDVEVSPRVIARIAQAAALQSYGVVGLSQRLRQRIGRLLRIPNVRRGIEVRASDREVVIDLYLVVEYGTRISEVAANAAASVKFAVERALGLPLVRVNVNIQGVRFREEGWKSR